MQVVEQNEVILIGQPTAPHLGELLYRQKQRKEESESWVTGCSRKTEYRLMKLNTFHSEVTGDFGFEVCRNISCITLSLMRNSQGHLISNIITRTFIIGRRHSDLSVCDADILSLNPICFAFDRK